MKILSSGEFEILPYYKDILQRLERAGRMSHKSEDKITKKSASEFILKLINMGHESVLEHEVISVRIICDRGVSHEWVRHRIASYTQESTRYCDYSIKKRNEGIHVIVPLTFGLETEKFQVWKEAMLAADHAYHRLRGLGATPQMARSVLPNSLKTELICTMNIREWRHFFRQRAVPAAHPQMRALAWPILEAFCKKWNVLFEDVYVEVYNKGCGGTAPHVTESGYKKS